MSVQMLRSGVGRAGSKEGLTIAWAAPGWGRLLGPWELRSSQVLIVHRQPFHTDLLVALLQGSL